MGITFRSGDYIKFVNFGHRTIKDGEAAAIWNARGVLTEVVGPRRVTLWFSTIRFLYHHQAARGQYLKVEHRDGTTEHLVGPVSLYHNPTRHKTIQVVNGHHLATEGDCLIIYGSGSGSVKGLPVKRRIVYGPQFVIPSDQESVHTFKWSARSSNPTGSQGGKAAHFHVLETNKIEQWRMKLPLKTEDGIVAFLDLAISYKIENAEKCLEVADPIAYVHSAILSDANRGDIPMSSIQTLSGQASTFPSFEDAMGAVGFRLLKLYLLDIALPKSVVEDHQLKKQESELQSKVTAEMKRDLELSRLAFEKKRAEADEQAAFDKAQGELNAELAEQDRAAQTAALHNELLLYKMRKEAQNEANKLANETQLEYLRGLQEIGVDVTKVLVAQALARQEEQRGKICFASAAANDTTAADEHHAEDPAVLDH